MMAMGEASKKLAVSLFSVLLLVLLVVAVARVSKDGIVELRFVLLFIFV